MELESIHPDVQHGGHKHNHDSLLMVKAVSLAQCNLHGYSTQHAVHPCTTLLNHTLSPFSGDDAINYLQKLLYDVLCCALRPTVHCCNCDFARQVGKAIIKQGGLPTSIRSNLQISSATDVCIATARQNDNRHNKHC